MDKSKSILENREEKNLFIQKYIDKYQVITLKANVPGNDKNIKEAYVLINYFDKLLYNLGFEKSYFLDGADGPMYIYFTDKNNNVKEKTIKLEESTLGRFVDIDVFNSYKSENRTNLRKCFICDKPAFVCAREKNHSLDELLKYLKQTVENELVKIIRNLCDKAIMEELNIHPKFGLVTPYSNGSHKDMNYKLMIKAKNAILDSLSEMFLVGYKGHDLKEIFRRNRIVGLEAERKMYEATNNVNAYKGLIFDLGLVLSAAGYILGNSNNENSIFDVIRTMTVGLTDELKIGNETFGKVAYQSYKVDGARGEAERGFPNVQYLLNNNMSNMESLIYLISNSDDTVLLKRCGSFEKYQEIKGVFQNMSTEKDKVECLTDKCIEMNLSFGGAADLLIVYLFIKELKNIFKI